MGAGLVAGAILASSVQAQHIDVIQFDLYKGQQTTQTVATLVTNGYQFSASLTPTLAQWITAASITPPGGTAKTLVADADSGKFVFNDTATTLAAFSAAYGLGSYNFNYTGQDDGAVTVPINLAADNYPAAPRFSQLGTLTNLDGTVDNTISWEAFVGATAQDAIRLAVFDTNGSSVFDTGGPEETQRLDGTATSTVIPADNLEAGKYTAKLTFYKLVVADSLSYPRTFAGFYSETSCALTVASGASSDTTPPTLTFWFPPNNDTVTNSLVPFMFSFDEPMADTVSIQWSANLTPSAFVYSWQDDTTLICSYGATLPSNATITWTLNPVAGATNNFRDLAGNELPANTYSGQFFTGKVPCNSATNSLFSTASFFMSKTVNYRQTTAAAAVFDPQEGASFSTITSSSNTASSGYVTIPTTPTTTTNLDFFTNPLTGLQMGSYLAEVTNSLAAFETAFPAGTYQLGVFTASGNHVANVPLTDTLPPVPHVANFGAIRAVPPNADFTLSWDPIPNANTNDYFINLLVFDSAKQLVFQAPDACVPRALPATASSIVIPQGTLAGGKTYDVSLSFFHTSATNISLIPGDKPGIAGNSRATRFSLVTTTGGTTTGPTIDSVRKSNGTNVQMQVSFAAGRTLTIATSSDLKTWTPAFTTNAATSPVSLVIPIGTAKWQFYRVGQN